MKTMFKKLYLITLLALAVIIISCGDDETDPVVPDSITANLGDNLSVDLESVVSLDASLSIGESLTYTYTITDPNGDNVTPVSNGTATTASFRASLEGTYSVSLEIMNTDFTETDMITVTAVNPTYTQADHMGRPAINTIFNYSSADANTNEGKDKYNSSYIPSTGNANYQAQFKTIFDALQSYIGLDTDAYRNILSVVPGAEGFGDNAGLATALSADVLNCNKDFPTTYGPSDLSAPVPFANLLNGRALSDDVIDVTLLLTFGGIFVDPNDAAQQNALVPGLQTDFVNANDVDFLNEFPYLAAPH